MSDSSSRIEALFDFLRSIGLLSEEDSEEEDEESEEDDETEEEEEQEDEEQTLEDELEETQDEIAVLESEIQETQDGVESNENRLTRVQETTNEVQEQLEEMQEQIDNLAGIYDSYLSTQNPLNGDGPGARNGLGQDGSAEDQVVSTTPSEDDSPANGPVPGPVDDPVSETPATDASQQTAEPEELVEEPESDGVPDSAMNLPPEHAREIANLRKPVHGFVDTQLALRFVKTLVDTVGVEDAYDTIEYHESVGLLTREAADSLRNILNSVSVWHGTANGGGQYNDQLHERSVQMYDAIASSQSD